MISFGYSCGLNHGDLQRATSLKNVTKTSAFYTFLGMWGWMLFPPKMFHPVYEMTILKELDGDTAHVKFPHGESHVSVRFAGIDALEKDQGRNFPQLKPGTNVKIQTLGRGRYGRILGRLIYEEVSISLQRLCRGEAYLYREARFRDWKERSLFFSCLEQAMLQSKGIWGQWNMNPYHFRRLDKNEAKLEAERKLLTIGAPSKSK